MSRRGATGAGFLLLTVFACAPEWSGPPVHFDHSLTWTSPALLDDPGRISLRGVFSSIDATRDPGVLLAQLLDTFARTAHSERAGPAQLADQLRATLGADPATWDFQALPFRITGVHNRIDLARGDHCGELRVSIASTDPVYAPLHLLFIFRQPASPDDFDWGRLTCQGTAREWAALSDEATSEDTVVTAWRPRLTPERFLMVESLEFTVAPWEWRQWTYAGGAFDNPPLFQVVDPARVNEAGPARDDFLSVVQANADAIDRRVFLWPSRFAAPSIRVNQGVPRTPVDLTGLPAQTLERYPSLRQHAELVGCPACHTAAAEFVQTRIDRTFSPFYAKELIAREQRLTELASGAGEVSAPFGPLQMDPVLPP